MRKVILYMITTVDGFIADPNGVLDYAPSLEEHTFANELFNAMDGLLFGRTIYEGFVGYWDTLDLSDPTVPAVEIEFAKIFRSKPRVVFSRTLRQVDAQAILINDSLATEVTKLKQQPGGDLLLVCGPELLATFLQHHLVDEFCLLICPQVLGHGLALLRDVQEKIQLQRLATRQFASGTVLLRYQLI